MCTHMITVNIRELRKNLANYIALTEKEVVEIIKRDVIVAVLSKPNGVHNKPSDVYTTSKIKPDVYTSVIPKEIIEKIPTSKTGVCKICGFGLDTYGQFCLGKKRHKQ